MTEALREKLREAGYAAGRIAALSTLIAEALGADLVTAKAGLAIEGLGELASRLSNDLIDAAQAD